MPVPFTHTGKFSADSLRARYPEPETPPADAEWIIVRENAVGVTTSPVATVIVTENPSTWRSRIERSVYLGHRGNIPLYAAELLPADPPGGMEYSGVRELFGQIPDEEVAIAGFAVQIVDFDRTTQFCGRCGEHAERLRTERAKTCPSCGLTVYPRLSPAIIVLVRDGSRILLARSPRFPPALHSVLAGFVEPGENLEHAVHREVREETGVEVKNLRYFGSEPWPFPNSLMIGFVAEYAGGEIAIDNNEIIFAGWFDRENLPEIPKQLSISRALIDGWLNEPE